MNNAITGAVPALAARALGPCCAKTTNSGPPNPRTPASHERPGHYKPPTPPPLRRQLPPCQTDGGCCSRSLWDPGRWLSMKTTCCCGVGLGLAFRGSRLPSCHPPATPSCPFGDGGRGKRVMTGTFARQRPPLVSSWGARDQRPSAEQREVFVSVESRAFTGVAKRGGGCSPPSPSFSRRLRGAMAVPRGSQFEGSSGRPRGRCTRAPIIARGGGGN